MSPGTIAIELIPMKPKTTNTSLAVIFGLAVSAGAAQVASAASIALTNAGFESDAIATNDGQSITPASWTLFAAGGPMPFVGDGAWLGAGGVTGAHTGDQYFLAYNFTHGHTTIHQNTGLLWADLSAGDTLTIAAWTTYRSDVSGNVPTYFWLNDPNGSSLYSSPMDVTDGGATAPGVWTERSWTYTVTQEKIDEAVANSWGAVNVQIGIVNFPGGDQQVLFDDVTLEYTAAIPEPSGVVLGGLGLGLFAFRRKRRS